MSDTDRDATTAARAELAEAYLDAIRDHGYDAALDALGEVAARAASQTTHTDTETYLSDAINRLQVNESIVHAECDAEVRMLGNPFEPPDPDRYGNRRTTYRCVKCGEQTTTVDPKHGRAKLEPGFEWVKYGGGD